jgi:hypothetical protein
VVRLEVASGSHLLPMPREEEGSVRRGGCATGRERRLTGEQGRCITSRATTPWTRAAACRGRAAGDGGATGRQATGDGDATRREAAGKDGRRGGKCVGVKSGSSQRVVRKETNKK